MYNFETGSWKTFRDYPFVLGSHLNSNAMVFIPETSAYLVIAGRSGREITDIANWELVSARVGMFKDGDWSNAGLLNRAHAVSLNLQSKPFRL